MLKKIKVSKFVKNIKDFIKVQIYSRIVHSEQLDQWMTRNMMEFSFDVDLAYLDNPNYQDKITSALEVN